MLHKWWNNVETNDKKMTSIIIYNQQLKKKLLLQFFGNWLIILFIMSMEIFYYGIKFSSFRICFSLPAKDMYILIQMFQIQYQL